MTNTNVSRGLSGHPYFLSVIDQLPEPLLGLAKNHLPGNQAIEAILVIPPDTHKHGTRWDLNPLQAVIFTKLGVLYLAASSKKG